MDTGPISRRDALWLGIAALPFVARLAPAPAAAQDIGAVPLPPDDALQDPLHRFWERLPDEFPLRSDILHFDTAGLGIPPSTVLERVQSVLFESAGSGDPQRALLDAARATLARFFGAAPEELALVRNATEGMNLVARGLDLRRGDEIVMTTHEHPGGAAPWAALRRDAGVTLRLVEPQFDAAADATRILEAMGKRTRVVVVSQVLATTGSPIDVAAIAAEARRRGVWCVVDGAQAAGILPVDLAALGADCYVASGHKWLLGPIETGILWIRRERLPDLRTRFGGQHATADGGWDLDAGRIEFRPGADRYEYGTRSAAPAAGLAVATEWLTGVGLDAIQRRSCALAQRFHAGIESAPGIDVLTPASALVQVPIVTFRVRQRPQTQVVDWLWSELRMRLRGVPERRLGAVRASFHVVDRTADVDWLVEAVRALGA
jgi:selenocysteine lyase/cysteine desulfurase